MDSDRAIKIESEIKDIKENHLAHIEPDIEKMKIAIAKIATNMEWHRWLLLAIAGGIGLLALKALGA